MQKLQEFFFAFKTLDLYSHCIVLVPLSSRLQPHQTSQGTQRSSRLKTIIYAYIFYIVLFGSTLNEFPCVRPLLLS